MKRVPAWCRIVPVLLVLSGCGGSPPSPTGPSTPSPFLTGSWSGTVTIQVNPGQPSEQPPTSGPTRWTFEVVPQSNLQSFQATVRSDHPWLPVVTIGTTALTPGNTARHRESDGPSATRVAPPHGGEPQQPRQRRA